MVTKYGHAVKAEKDTLLWSDFSDQSDWEPRMDNEAGSFFFHAPIVQVRAYGDNLKVQTGCGDYEVYYVGLPWVYDVRRDYSVPYDELGY
jgi:hypothetical protein